MNVYTSVPGAAIPVEGVGSPGNAMIKNNVE